MRSCVAAAVCGQTVMKIHNIESERSKTLVCRLVLCCSLSNFGTQLEHNFRKRSLSDTILWRSDREICGKCRESDKIVILLFYCTHQIFINHRWSAAPRIIMHIFASFIKVSRPSPYHWITHGMFSIHLTNLTMNVSRFHVPCMQETDYGEHFACGGLLNFLEHSKHTGQCVKAVRLCKSRPPLPKQRTNKPYTYAHRRDRSASAAIFANVTYFVDTPHM
jgi:hypothetical protein